MVLKTLSKGGGVVVVILFSSRLAAMVVLAGGSQLFVAREVENGAPSVVQILPPPFGRLLGESHVFFDPQKMPSISIWRS